MEVEKLIDLLESLKKRNEDRIEAKVMQNKSEKHMMKLKELNILKKEAKDVETKNNKS